MAKATWKQVCGKLEPRVGEGVELLIPPVEELEGALDAFETEISCSLPESYRGFVRRFGPGELQGYFRIFAPIPKGVKGTAEKGHNIARQRKMLQDPEGYWAQNGNPGLVCFADLENDGWFFWDPEDVRSARRHEYGIYYHPRSNMAGEVELVASSFPDFIQQICLDKGFAKGWGMGRPDWTFCPAWPYQRKRPEPRSRRKQLKKGLPD